MTHRSRMVRPGGDIPGLILLCLTIVANAGTFTTAQKLWSDPPTRSAVTEAAAAVVEKQDAGKPCTGDDRGDPKVPDLCGIKSAADTTSALTELGLPVGWDKGAWEEFKGDLTSKSALTTMLGWLVTALLVMLGAPFWFDLLTKLVSLRSSGKKPDSAADDASSSTSQMANRSASPVAVLARTDLAAAVAEPATTVNEQLQAMFGTRSL